MAEQDEIMHLRNEAKKWQVLVSQGIQIERELRAEVEQLRVAIINLLDDGDETDRAAALKLVRPDG